MNKNESDNLDESINAITEAFRGISETANRTSEIIQDLMEMQIQHVRNIIISQKIKLAEYLIRIRKSYFPINLIYKYRFKKLLKRYVATKRAFYAVDKLRKQRLFANSDN